MATIGLSRVVQHLRRTSVFPNVHRPSRWDTKVRLLQFPVPRTTALKAKAMIHRRRVKEREAGTLPKFVPADEVWPQVQGLLDEELGRLPDKYRVSIVLCDLEGKTIKEAARHLGWPQGTVATRLAQGRKMLAKRVSKAGLT